MRSKSRLQCDADGGLVIEFTPQGLVKYSTGDRLRDF
jgi:hypothetical protein